VSAKASGAWLAQHPGIEIVSRDRQGLYAEGARVGALQARQVADRFHLVQNMREMIEKQLGRLERPLRAQGSTAIEDEDTRAGLHRLRQVRFEQDRLLYDAGKTATAIAEELGLSRAGRLMDTPASSSRTKRHGAHAKITGLLPRPPIPPVSRRMHRRPSPLHENPAHRLYRLLYASVTIRLVVAAKDTECAERNRFGIDRACSPETLRQAGRCRHRLPPAFASSQERS